MSMVEDVIVTTPTTTQHNLKTVVGLDMKMTVYTTPQPHKLNSSLNDHN